MVEYGPIPDRLDQMNPIQRWMQKPSLETSDYAWLLILVLGYVVVRPYTKEAIKWLIAPKEVKEGDKAMKEHFEARAKVDANSIRGSNKTTEPGPIPAGKKDVAASGSNIGMDGQVSNRKLKSTTTGKSEEDKLVDWDDEPPREPVPGDKTDVVAWLDKWDK